MATINLGSIKFNWRGAYAAGTAYSVDDVVSYNGGSYVCILASTGNLPTNTTYWNVMAQGGDVSTTLTTQGDILYRDGSGLQRLAAGTNGQALLTGGAGANPSWGTVSSDWVRVNTTSITNGAASVLFDNVFTSSYNNYKVIANGIKGHNSTDGYIYITMRSGGSNMTGGYYGAGHHTYRTSSTSTNGVDGRWNHNSIDMGGWSSPDSDTHSNAAAYDMEFNFFRVNSTDHQKNMTYQYFGFEAAGNYTVMQSGGFLLNNNSAVDGFGLHRTNSGMSSSGKIIVYGLKE